MSKLTNPITDAPEFELDAESDNLDDIPSESEVRKMFKEIEDELEDE